MPVELKADATYEDEDEPGRSVHMRTFILSAPKDQLSVIEMMNAITTEAVNILAAEYEKLEATIIANDNDNAVPDGTPDILIASVEMASHDGQGFGLRLALNVTYCDCPAHGKDN